MKNGPYELVIAPPEYPGKKYRGRYCYEHHLVYWQHTGLVPDDSQCVHHKNENKRDNRFENLELILRHGHKKLHGLQRHLESVVEVKCDYCTAPMVLDGRDYNGRLANKMGMFCSRSCGALYQFHVYTGG